MTARTVFAAALGGVLGSGGIVLLTGWLGFVWGCLVFASLAGIFVGSVWLWYRVIWPLDEIKPALPWKRRKEDA